MKRVRPYYFNGDFYPRPTMCYVEHCNHIRLYRYHHAELSGCTLTSTSAALKIGTEAPVISKT